jgi:hypothetical protein
VDVPPGTVNFVGLVFKLRGLPLEPGTRHEFPVLAGRRLKTIAAEVLGREEVETKAGKFPAVKVRVPTGFTGKFSEKNPTLVWFSDDARRIVVRITSDFAVGHATASLVSYSPGALRAAADPTATSTSTATSAHPERSAAGGGAESKGTSTSTSTATSAHPERSAAGGGAESKGTPTATSTPTATATASP